MLTLLPCLGIWLDVLSAGGCLWSVKLKAAQKTVIHLHHVDPRGVHALFIA